MFRIQSLRRISSTSSLIINNVNHSRLILNKFSTHLQENNEENINIEIDLKSKLINDFRTLHEIRVKGEDSADFDPIIDFESTPFAPSLKRVLKSEGFTEPTATQAQSWPIAFAKRDVISVARTGSGKTCGFLLPAFHKLMLESDSEPVERVPFVRENQRGRRPTSNNRSRLGRSPKVLVLAPTRELTLQIESEAQKYSRATGLSALCLYGGTPKGPQIRQLRSGTDIIVATPGRCNDLAEMGLLDLSKISYLVLDEADRMLDMGFEPQIRQIIDQLQENRQSLFFTATWPREVQNLAKDFVTNPIQINIGDSNGLNANKAITQHVIVLRPNEKIKKLGSLLEDMNENEDKHPKFIPKSIIFVARKSDCDDLADILADSGYAVDTLHGDMSQAMRSKAMDRFRRGQLRILVATDVAARGLDVKDIETVINYDFPVGSSGVEDYVHRIGRTARGDRTGVSYTFITHNDRLRSSELINVMKRCDQIIPPELEAMVPRNGGGERKSNYSRGGGSRGGYQGGNRNSGGRFGGFDRGGGSGGYSRSKQFDNNSRGSGNSSYGGGFKENFDENRRNSFGRGSNDDFNVRKNSNFGEYRPRDAYKGRESGRSSGRDRDEY
jgi:ATP-dependent RNA helicase DDX5/DBP2